MSTTSKLQIIFNLLAEVLKDMKEIKENADERYLVIENNKLRARNQLLFEENKQINENRSTKTD